MKRGRFTNFEVLFPEMSVDFCYQHVRENISYYNSNNCHANEDDMNRFFTSCLTCCHGSRNWPGSILVD